MPPVQTPIRCSNCGQPFQATVRSVIDVANDPQAKALLLSGQLNVNPCPHCGAVNNIMTPILYHDAQHELLIAFVPPQVASQHGGDEKVIADLLNELGRIVPKEQFRGYMFNPKRALTLQGVIDQVLQADGVTPEMLEAQRQRVQLVQQLLSTPEADLQQFVEDNDEFIDQMFFQTVLAMAQRLSQDGQVQFVEQLAAAEDALLEYSSYGRELAEQQSLQEQTIEAVANDIQNLGDDPQLDDFIQLVVSYKDDDTRLQALVGLVRPAFEYQFFQAFTAFIGKAPAAERDSLEAARQKLLQYTQAIDQQSQQAVQQAVGLLQTMISSPNPDAVIRTNLSMIDDTFMAVLSANIQEAEKRQDLESSSRLKTIYDKVVTVLREQMQPELRFVNDLLSVEDDAEMRQRIAEQAPQFGAPLLEVIDAVERVLQAQGAGPVLQRLGVIREETVAVLD